MPLENVQLQHASRLINHGPTVLVGSAHGGRRNLMAAAWSMPVEFTPPRVVVVIDKSTFTRGLVTEAGGGALTLTRRLGGGSSCKVRLRREPVVGSR